MVDLLFQAEDGIRGLTVTGVQTCALPIFMPQLLPVEDDEVAKEFTRIFKKKGIDVYADAKVDAAEVHEGGVKVTVTAKGKQQLFDVEVVLSATGRRAVTENCGLETTKVQLDRGMVQVDPFMRTGEPGVYAIGDIVPTPALAHVASAEGILAIQHIKGMEVRPINYDHVQIGRAHV